MYSIGTCRSPRHSTRRTSFPTPSRPSSPTRSGSSSRCHRPPTCACPSTRRPTALTCARAQTSRSRCCSSRQRPQAGQRGCLLPPTNRLPRPGRWLAFGYVVALRFIFECGRWDLASGCRSAPTSSTLRWRPRKRVAHTASRTSSTSGQAVAAASRGSCKRTSAATACRFRLALRRPIACRSLPSLWAQSPSWPGDRSRRAHGSQAVDRRAPRAAHAPPRPSAFRG